MAKMKSISVEFGCSQATGPNTWLKAAAKLEIELDKPEDAEMKDAIWEDAWLRVTEEVAKQLKKLDAPMSSGNNS